MLRLAHLPLQLYNPLYHSSLVAIVCARTLFLLMLVYISAKPPATLRPDQLLELLHLVGLEVHRLRHRNVVTHVLG